MNHELKINLSFADAIVGGRKTFELRRNDRGFQAGDIVTFIPVDGCGIRTFHEIDRRRYEITYVMNGYGLENGYVAFGIREAAEK